MMGGEKSQIDPAVSGQATRAQVLGRMVLTDARISDDYHDVGIRCKYVQVGCITRPADLKALEL